MGFRFVNHGPLIDGDLELVRPAARWIGDVMASIHASGPAIDPADAPEERQLLSFVQSCPDGHEKGDWWSSRPPAYHFWFRLRHDPRSARRPPVPMAGTLGLRIGQTEDLLMYLGHIGYGVYPPARGNHYAERACRLVLPIAKAHGMNRVWITANPDNYASRRTIERLGGEMVEIVDLPTTHPLYARGERQKCRYRVRI